MPNGVSVSELLDDLSSRGVELWVEDDDKLRFRAPAGAVTADLREFVSAQRSGIVAHPLWNGRRQARVDDHFDKFTSPVGTGEMIAKL